MAATRYGVWTIRVGRRAIGMDWFRQRLSEPAAMWAATVDRAAVGDAAKRDLVG